MEINNKLEFLNKYTLSKNLKVELLRNDDLDNLNIPQIWKEIFSEENGAKRKEKLLEQWSKYLEKELSNTITYLSKFLEDVELMKIGDTISVLYSIKSNKTGRILYYEGGNPLDSPRQQFDQLKKDWNTLPKEIRNFYTYLHNGFYYYPNKSMGLDAVENITYLDDYEWEVIEEIGSENIGINVKTSYGLFSNGMGSYCDRYK